MDYRALHRESIDRPEEFWRNQLGRIEWTTQPSRILDRTAESKSQWFTDGTLNLCHNAVDRWAAEDPAEQALIHVSGETGQEKVYSRQELLGEVQRWAAAFQNLGVAKGDRVLLYLPMIPQAVFAMLACLRIGAVHSVVFGGFAGHALASRIDDARPRLVVAADGGLRGGRTIDYLDPLKEALTQASHEPAAVLVVNRGLSPVNLPEGAIEAEQYVSTFTGSDVPPVPVKSGHPSYILYTSGTTGKPKGVQRDTGGHAVALTASMEHIFTGAPGETFLAASDIGWVVGHSYIVYGPLLSGRATVLYEGTPLHPDAGVLWRIVERYSVKTMFIAPTALRVLRGAGRPIAANHDLSSLNAVFVAGEPLDEGTSQWAATELGVPIIDNYWQTETGWPILTHCRGLDNRSSKAGSCGFPVFGYDVRIISEDTGADMADGEKGMIVIAQPLPPGTLSTIWEDDKRFTETYFKAVPGDHYCTFDWGIRDKDGYHFVLGRSDDVINVAGHRLGTREIEEVLCRHPLVSEAAVVGVADPVKTQVPVALIVASNDVEASQLERELADRVNTEIGRLARPERFVLLKALPKTRSGKILRRAIQAILEERDPGDLTTIEDAAILAPLREAAQRPV